MSEYKILIKSTTPAWNQANTYIMNYLVEREKMNNLIIDNTSVLKINNEIEIFYKLPMEKVKFKYSGLDCECYLKEKGITMGRFGPSDSLDLAYDLHIIIYDGNTDILKQFQNDAYDWYKTNVLNKKRQADKITCYNWEGWCWEVSVKQDKRQKSTLYYTDKFMDNIMNDLKHFLSDKVKEVYNRLGITYKRCYLFEGPPGTGKSSLIYGIASEFNKDIAFLSIDEELKSQQLMDAIKKIPKESILVIEDIDSIFDKREKKEVCQKISFSTLINAIDGVIKPTEGSIIIFTTNFKNKLDEALKRPGRVDSIINFEYAHKSQIKKMFEMYFPDEKDKFELFYSKIKHLKKMTICYLQKYFLKYLFNTENMYDNIKELEEIIQECDLYKDGPSSLYN